MKRVSMVLVFLAFATSAFASSLNVFVPNQSVEGYQESWGGNSYAYSELYGSSSNLALGGSQYTWMEVYNNGSSSMTNFAQGEFEYEFQPKNGGWLYIEGSLSGVKFNSLTNVLSATFSGWAEKYNPSTYSWGDQYFTGSFFDKLPATTTQNYSCCGYTYSTLYGSGPGHITLNGMPSGFTPQDVGGTAAVPEPASLIMFGTGLIGIAGVVRRKLKV